jgi:hypothetical protein
MSRLDEIGEQIAPHEALHAQAVLVASERLMPDMSSARETQLLADRTAAGDAQVRFANADQDAVRARIIEITARVLDSGKLAPNTKEGRIVSKAIAHQLTVGGPVAADSLGPAISSKLNGGMKLEITQDKELERRARQHARENGMPEPGYVRRVQLRDADGKVLGSMAIAISVEPRKKGVLI